MGDFIAVYSYLITACRTDSQTLLRGAQRQGERQQDTSQTLRRQVMESSFLAVFKIQLEKSLRKLI